MADALAAPEGAYADHGAIQALITRRREEWGKGREAILRPAYRNLLFARGHHWIRWDRITGRWRPAVIPKDIPTPVTNVFSSTMDAVISVFARIEPQLNFRPGNPDEPDDRATADVARRLIHAIEDEVSVRRIRQVLASWVGFTGGCWLETGYDPDPIHGTRTIDVERCATCQHVQEPGNAVCEGCGQPGGLQPDVERVPIGKMFVDCVPLFEAYFDAAITEWSKHRAFLREKSVSVDEAKARWPALADGIQPNAQGTTGDDWYMGALATLGPNMDDKNQTRWTQGAGQSSATRVTESWYWQLPDATYPEGLLAVLLGRRQIAYAAPLPYTAVGTDGERQPFLPLVWFPQKRIPGSFWPKTVADDVALKQAQRNRWESIVESCGMRMGSPVWLKPLGSNVKNLTGGPGQVIEYNPIGPANAKPERIPGQGIPLAFIQMIAQCDKDLEELAATYDVVKGSRPEGVSAGIALQILQERGMSRYGPLFIEWETAWSEWARQALEIFRQFATEERLLRIRGRDGRWEVEKFIGADLQGRVDAIPEAGSSMPRSTLLDRAEMEQLAAMQIINPQDPETQFKFLEVYGRTNLLPSMAADTKNAIMENEAFEQLAQAPAMAMIPPELVAQLELLPYPVFTAELEALGLKMPKVSAALDGHSIHSREHKTYGKSETFRALPRIGQLLLEKHTAYHDELLVQQMTAVRQGGAVQGGYLQPAPGAGGGATQESPMNAGSSGERMQGEMGEMASGVASGMGP